MNKQNEMNCMRFNISLSKKNEQFLAFPVLTTKIHTHIEKHKNCNQLYVCV